LRRPRSITKLTEMAFFFIPLTFAATVFSMQVKELNASIPPISTFIILAASITIGVYAQRLAMHNAWIWKRMRFITEELVPRTSEIKSAVQIFFWSLYYRCTRWCGLLVLKRMVCEMPCTGLPWAVFTGSMRKVRYGARTVGSLMWAWSLPLIWLALGGTLRKLPESAKLARAGTNLPFMLWTKSRRFLLPKHSDP